MRTARQRLYLLRRLKRFSISSNIMSNFYRCTIENILTGCITGWYGNCSSFDRKALQRVMRIEELIIGHKLPSLQDIYQTRCLRKACSIIKDRTHPAHHLFATLPFGRCLRSIRSWTTRLKNSFYLQAIRLLNSSYPSSKPEYMLLLCLLFIVFALPLLIVFHVALR